jgi:general secretion pathway protein D
MPIALPTQQPQSGIPAVPSLLQGQFSKPTDVEKKPTNRQPISLNFDDADVYAVTQTIFGNVLRVNYIIDPRVKGRVTFKSVSPVAYENVLPVMEVILRLNGIAVVEDSSLYRIIPISEIAREPSPVCFGRAPESITLTGKALLQVIPIRFAVSSDIVKLITPFVSVNAVVVDVPKTNQVVIVDTDANVKRLLNLINIFDSEQLKQKAPHFFVYRVQNAKAKDIVALLQQVYLGQKPSPERTATKVTSAQTSSFAPQIAPHTHPTPQQTMQSPTAHISATISDTTKILADELTNTVIVLGSPEDFEVLKEAIKMVDVIPRQVVIEGVIVQVSLTDNLSLGLAWSISTGGNAFGMKTSTLDPAKLPGTGFSYVYTDASGVIRTVISALASESKAKLLASPHILVSDNREARIQVGQSVPIPTSETYGSTTVAPQRTIQYKDIGIILKVKPQINDSGLVSLDLTQEVSTFSTILLYSDEKQIILNKTEASTTLVVQDGQSIVIGGLIREDKSKTRSGIPFLSKIPILGYLFGDTAVDDSRTEIIILLTPHVVKAQKEAAVITSGFVDKFLKNGTNKEIKKEELIKNLRPLNRNAKDGSSKK